MRVRVKQTNISCLLSLLIEADNNFSEVAISSLVAAVRFQANLGDAGLVRLLAYVRIDILCYSQDFFPKAHLYICVHAPNVVKEQQ